MVQSVKRVQEESCGFTIPATMGDEAGADSQRPGEAAFLMGVRGHHLYLKALGPPLKADLGQQADE